MAPEFQPQLLALIETTGEAAVLVRAAALPRPLAEVLAANRRLLELVGHDAAALVGRSLRRLLDPAQPRERLVRLRNAIVARESFEGPLRLTTARGEPCELRARLAHLPGTEGLSVLWLQAADDPFARLVGGIAPWAGLAREGFYILGVGDDCQLRLLWANQAFYSACGRGEGDPALAHGPNGVVHSADRTLARKRLQRLLAGEDATLEYRILTPEGTVRRVRDAARPFRDAQGVVRMILGALGVAPDEIDETRAGKLAERAAEILAHACGALVCLVDAQGRVRWVSPEPRDALAELLRVQLPHAMEPILAPRDQDLWLELVDEARATGERVLAQLTARTAHAPVLLEVSLIAIDQELLIALLRAKEGSLFKSEPSAPAPAPPTAPAVPSSCGLTEEGGAPFTPHPAVDLSLLDAVATALVGLDRSGVIGFLNRAAERLFGRERATLLGHPLDELLSGEDASALKRLVLEELPRSGAVRELLGRRASGELVPLEVTASPVLVPGLEVLLTLRDATLARFTEETLRSLAYLDPLTGLPNRLLFIDRLTQAIERARRAQQLLAVMIVDLDRFKLVNDSLGFERGDQLLKAVGERLRGVLRRSDTVARLASDRFLVLITGLASTDPIVKVAHKLLRALEAPFVVNGHELTVTAGIGIAVFPHDGEDASTLVKNADIALGRAKELGRGHVQFYTNDMNAQAFERLMLESRLHRALDNGELVVFYQPQVSLRTGRVVGVEALARWFHPELGLVPPQSSFL